ncbi:MAG: glycosyltransferase [Planctomycetota bacterium]|nr:glycosyltransferase [Planctomycetota bacterium]
MRFLFIVSGKDVPSTRFRILPYIPILEKNGHRCDIAYSYPQKYDYFPTIGWRLSQLLKRSVRHWHSFLAARRQYDSIVIEREVFDDDTIAMEEKLRKSTKHLVLDVDDGVFLLHPKKFDALARMSDVAIAGNRWLKEYLQSRTPRVEQIPTCVSLAAYPIRNASLQRQDNINVGWIGTTNNVSFLSVAAPALRRLASETTFRLVVVAPSDEKLQEVDLSGVDIDFRKWSPETEVDDLRDMDLGLMPLPDGEEWMKYKCGLKLIQYLAVGIPGIASPIGVNEEILADGKVGRAVTNDEEWYQALKELVRNVTLRQTLGQAGRELVEQEYSIEGNAQKLEQILSNS